MAKQMIFLFQELTLKAYQETQFQIGRVKLNMDIGIQGDELLERIENFISQLTSELIKIFETLNDSDQSDEVIEFFKDIELIEMYEKFLIYYDKEVEALI